MPIFELEYTLERKNKGIVLPSRDALRISGPCLAVVIDITKEHKEKLKQQKKEFPEPITGIALIDTGASSSGVYEKVCKKLNLKPTSIIKMHHAGGIEERACYPIQFFFPHTGIPPRDSLITASFNLGYDNTPYIFLLGRDILSYLKFVYNGIKGRIELAY